MSTALDTHLPGAPAAVQVRRRTPHAWIGFGVVAASAVMDLLDSTIAQTAAPAIRKDLGGSFADLEWITAAYTLAMSVMLLVGGRLGDIFGRRRVLLGGLAGFAGTSALCALAPSADALIACRGLQGMVGAVMIPQGFGLLREIFGDEGQQKAFAIFGPVMGLTAVAGPLLGGALVSADVAGLGWRAIFLVNVPVGLLAIAAGRGHLPDVAPSAAGTRIDLPSAMLAVAGGAAVVYPLVEGRQLGWPVWSVVLPLAGLAVLGLFARRQAARVRAWKVPLVEPSILTRRAYVGGLALIVAFMGAMAGMVLALNVMFQTGLGRSPLACGVATAAVPLAAIAGSIASSALVDRIGRTVLHVGIAIMGAGLVAADLVLRARGGGLSAWDLAAPLAVTGLGMGMIFMPLFDCILAGVEPHQLGSASGLMEAVQQFGMSLGIAIVGTVLFGAVAPGGGAAAFVSATDHALLVVLALLAAAFAVVFALPRRARQPAAGA